MPIKGLTDRPPRLPVIGTIHLGIVVPNKSGHGEHPQATDYFVVTERDNTPAAMVKAFKDVYGDKPNSLDIVFPTDQTQQYADPNYESWSQSLRRVCKGDGETARAKWDMDGKGPVPTGDDGEALIQGGSWATGESKQWVWREIPCRGDECPMLKASKCKPVMHCMFLLPKVRGVGVWRVTTGSRRSFSNILDNLAFMQSLAGRVRGIPLKLRLVPIQVTPEGEKKKTVHVLDLGFSEATPEEMLAAAARLPDDRLLAAPEHPEGDDPWLHAKMQQVEEDDEPVDADPPPLIDRSGDVTNSADGPTAVPDAEPVDVTKSIHVPEFQNVGEFLTYCLKEHGLGKSQVVELLGFDLTQGAVSRDILHDGYVKIVRKLNEAKAEPATA